MGRGEGGQGTALRRITLLQSCEFLLQAELHPHTLLTHHTSHTHILHTHTHTHQSQSYPLDGSAIQALLQRAADAVSPLLDKLYEKAFQSHQSVFDPAVTKYDLTFRLKNTQRLLALVCCNLWSPMNSVCKIELVSLL